MKEETARLEGIEKEERKKAKEAKVVEKEWEATREQRVGTWRDFMATSKGAAAGCRWCTVTHSFLHLCHCCACT